MISMIFGSVEGCTPGWVDVRVGQVVCRALCSARTSSAVERRPDAVCLITKLSVVSELIVLYGFATREELVAFESLTKIRGVGPAAALRILSELTPSDIRQCIKHGDSSAIRSVKGIGPKTANRILKEYRI